MCVCIFVSLCTDTEKYPRPISPSPTPTPTPTLTSNHDDHDDPSITPAKKSTIPNDKNAFLTPKTPTSLHSIVPHPFFIGEE